MWRGLVGAFYSPWRGLGSDGAGIDKRQNVRSLVTDFVADSHIRKRGGPCHLGPAITVLAQAREQPIRGAVLTSSFSGLHYCSGLHDTRAVIKGFRPKGLERFFTKSERKGIDAKQADRIRRILDRRDAAVGPEDMDLPGYKFHGLVGLLKGFYAVSVSGNWRITFRFSESDAIDVNFEDYH